MKLLKRLSLPVLCACLILTGCIGDDLSGCPPDNNLHLAFSYPNFPERISCVTVSIYDNATGCLLSENRLVGKDELDVFQGISLRLAAGSYTAVCWGNALENTRINGCSTGDNFSSHEVGHPRCFTSDSIPTNDALYYGIHSFTIHENTPETQTVAFSPAHIRLIVQAQGLSSTAQGQPAAGYPYIRVNNLFPTYDYRMVTHGNPTAYYPPITVDTGELLAQAGLDVLRFEAVNPITVDVVENNTTHTVLHSLNLQSFIAANNIDVSPGREVVIPILITFNGQSVTTVTVIEDWGERPVDPIPQQ